MNPKIVQILSGGPVVTDGGWGTQLQALGLSVRECADAYNLFHPELVEQVARSYVEAGSQIILTNTFRANRFALADHGLAEKTGEINRAGAAISGRAAVGKALVFASIGPSGKMLLTGEVSEEALYEAFLEQARSLAVGGADGIVIETMSDLIEATLALKAAKEAGLPVVASMVYDSGKEKNRTMMGVTPEQAAEALAAAGADVIGANCGQGIEGFIPICQRLRRVTDMPLWMKANAGMPELVDGKAVYKTGAKAFSQYIPQLIEAGASFVGGCCGTNPDFIREIVKILKNG